ncbi:hypothetical protein BJX66DRAFT_334943 [Aspergillus keveii]|jgi:hypothetical protein|uniref:Uncharacterized protein n=1 Tax=Aspergillus keveii TaxID=714993 RepID=A0ABR4GF13_9EURO
MKPSTILLCLAPTIAIVQAERAQDFTHSPSVSNTSPTVAVPDVQTIPEDDVQIPSEADQLLRLQVADTQSKPDTISIPLLSRSTRSRWTRRTTAELTKRSEGTLGQTPWIGMAIGLTCTALAAVMLG